MGKNNVSVAKRMVAVIAALALAASCFLCSCVEVHIVSNSSNTANTSASSNSASSSNGPTSGAYTVENIDYKFRTKSLLNSHYEKHGKEMGFISAADYEKAASEVANNPVALHKLEKEDNDDVYYLEATNDFVIISTDGYIRTYFWPNGGKAYFDRQ